MLENTAQIRPPGWPQILHRAAPPVVLTCAVAAPWILDAYTISLAAYALVLGLLAVSAHLLTTVAGLPTLGQGAYLTVGGYLAGNLARTVTDNGPLQLLAAAAGGALAAAAVGVLAVQTRGTVFLMITLAVGILVQTVAGKAAAVTGGDAGMTVDAITMLPGTAPVTRIGYLYLYTLAWVVLVGAGLAILLRSRFGLALRAIADNEDRARANGYPATTYLWAAYILAGGIAGTAGALLVATRHTIGPVDGGFTVSALALLAALLTSRSQTGAMLGAALIVGVRDHLSPAVWAGHATALLGALFLLATYGRRLCSQLTRRPP
ncbi:branched-chain amino acid ABC transporter permease [Dactylosporangium sp. NPDC005572]|uniref:branched-chain amino acid ABC transporter permease n=1 Tax=Dactylosporangium sp. NPDC005572 TaxID=3156889 RepID=UPI0033AFE8BB